MQGKKSKNFKIIASLLILSLFLPIATPFSKNIAYGLGDDYQGANGETSDSAYDPTTFNSNSLSSGGSAISSQPFSDGTAQSLMSVTAGCGNLAGRFTTIIEDLSKDKNAKVSLEQINGIAVDSTKVTLNILGNLAEDGKLKNEKLSSYLTKQGYAGTKSGGNVKDTEAIALLKKIDEKEKAQLKILKENKVWTQCLEGIAFKVAQKQLASMTKSIIKWVHTGLEGNSLYVKDQDSYFNKIRNDALESFISPLLDPVNWTTYPYGRSTARGLILDSNSTFAERSKSTLANSLPTGVTTEDFSNDFSKGGWTGWLALTQNPANNPLGFALIASQEASKQVSKAEQKKIDELTQGRGFLSVSKCVERKPQPTTYGVGEIIKDSSVSLADTTLSFDPANTEMSRTGFSMNIRFEAKKAGTLKTTLTTYTNTLVEPNQTFTFSAPSLLSQAVHISYDDLEVATKYKLFLTYTENTPNAKAVEAGLFYVSISPKEASSIIDPLSDKDCLRREIVTPGSLVADQVSAVLTSPVRQLELADSVNKSLDSVFLTLINDLTQKGFSSLGDYASNRDYVTTNSYTSLRYYDDTGNLITVNRGYGGWYSGIDNFDITKDLGDISLNDKNGNSVVVKKGIISIQQEYIDSAKATKASLIPILKAVGNLDYCLPGPNPSWESSANERISDVRDYIASQEYGGTNLLIRPFWANAQQATAGVVGIAMLLPPAGTIIGSVIGIGAKIFDSIQSGKNDKNKIALDQNNAYAEDLFYTNIKTQLNSIDTTFDDYTDYINSRYGESLDDKLSIASDAKQITKNLTTYAVNIEEANRDYDTEISTTTTNIKKLKSIKVEVDKIVKAARDRRDVLIGNMRRQSGANAINFCPGVDSKTDSIRNATNGGALGDATTDPNNGPVAECNDGIDNGDVDTLIDRADPQCHSDGDATHNGPLILAPDTYVPLNNE